MNSFPSPSLVTGTAGTWQASPQPSSGPIGKSQAVRTSGGKPVGFMRPGVRSKPNGDQLRAPVPKPLMLAKPTAGEHRVTGTVTMNVFSSGKSGANPDTSEQLKACFGRDSDLVQ